MKRTQRVLRTVYILTLAVMVMLASNVFFVSVMKVHLRSDTDLSVYSNSANTVSTVEKALRGNIYDRNGTLIAEDSRTYNIYCILDENRPAVADTITYVKDKEGTAAALSKILKMDYQTCLDYLTQDVFQTELGPAGRNLSQNTKKEIEELGLPGIEFMDSIERIYPLGSFASNLIGYAQSDENGTSVGKMGMELYLDSYLRGKDGYSVYQADKYGFILPGMKEETISAVNGYDVYTTIDQHLQEVLQETFTLTEKRFNTSRAWGSVMEISTGKILAWGQSPSFDPNELNITDYNDYGSQLPYEPGSTMKTFTYAAAINEGKYNGTDKVDSGPYCFYNDENNNPIRVPKDESWGCIYNAARQDYGMIDYDYGLIQSLNTITAEVQNSLINPDIHLQYLRDFGFFHEVNTDGLPDEVGLLNFQWPADKLALCYGQGSTVTMLQMLQAYSAIFGDGTMVKPYFVESIRNPYDRNDVVYQAERKVVGHPITKETTDVLKEILYRVFNDEEKGSAKYYNIPECRLMGKTGTAEVSAAGTYATETTITSVMLAMPAENPQVMVYYCFESEYDGNSQVDTAPVQNLLRKTAIHLGFANTPNMEGEETEEEAEAKPEAIVTTEMPSLVNHSLSYVRDKLQDKHVTKLILGGGDTVIAQYPEAGSGVTTGQKVFLMTDAKSFVMPDMTGWTRKEVTALWSVSQFGFKLEGEGFVTGQNIAPGTVVTKGTEIEVTFE